jgi:predicted Zn-ribbon and HTH transcriptional regulator
MGLLDRLLGHRSASGDPLALAVPVRTFVLGGRDTLEVVGESHYQETLWHAAGGFRLDRVRTEIRAQLWPEPSNRHDENAIRVLIDGSTVGYLGRDDAALYLPGLKLLIEQHGAVHLNGMIVGGGQRSHGLGMLGVFLDHDPADFGLRRRQLGHIGELRTGLSQALATDLDDDSYDLSWLDQLSGGHQAKDIVILRNLLDAEQDPIDRHFMLSELGKCLYKSRDAFASALDEFDAVCEAHHGEMAVIREALVGKFGRVPLIEMYRQAAIRCQKAHDWDSARRWAERGLAVYGSEAARPEAVADLEKRLAYAEDKLALAPRRNRLAGTSAAPVTGTALVIETLVCTGCGATFERTRTRGRKPHRCPACRGEPADVRTAG